MMHSYRKWWEQQSTKNDIIHVPPFKEMESDNDAWVEVAFVNNTSEIKQYERSENDVKEIKSKWFQSLKNC